MAGGWVEICKFKYLEKLFQLLIFLERSRVLLYNIYLIQSCNSLNLSTLMSSMILPFLFFRKDLMYSSLVLNLMYKWRWPRTSDPPTSMSWVLELHTSMHHLSPVCVVLRVKVRASCMLSKQPWQLSYIPSPHFVF